MSFRHYLIEQKTKPIQSNFLYGKGVQLGITDNYEQIAKEGYQENGLVFSILDKLSDIFAGLPFIIEDKAGEQIKDHPVLRLINKPNDYQGRKIFFKEVFSYYYLAGASTTRKMRSADNRPPAMLYNIVPNAIVPIAANRSGEILRYEMNIERGVSIPVQDILYWKSFNPLQPERGFSRVKASGLLIDMMNTMTKWNIGLLQNGAVPPMVIKPKGTITKEQATALEDKYFEKMAGYRNSGKPLIQGGEAEYQVLGIKPSEVQWFESLQMVWRYTCVALGVSPEMFGSDKGTTFNNRSEAYKDLMVNFMIPKAEQFLELLTNELLHREYKDSERQGLHFVIDKSDIPVLADSQDSLTTRVISAYNNGLMTYEESRTELGYDPNIKPEKIEKEQDEQLDELSTESE